MTYAKVVRILKRLLEKKDLLTLEHSKQVSKLSVQLANELIKENIDIKCTIEEVEMAGLLHDVGKLLMDDCVLKGSHKISPKDSVEIKEHISDGYKILSHFNFNVNIREAVAMHHERDDGSGYPEGLKEDEISILGKILAVTDSYSAITQKRTYKEGKSKDESLRILKKEKYLYDPFILKIFIRMMTNSPL
jgi:putative nucleotidyltransferase with HDIG domain